MFIKDVDGNSLLEGDTIFIAIRNRLIKATVKYTNKDLNTIDIVIGKKVHHKILPNRVIRKMYIEPTGR